jgi:hypothetical protein
MTGHVLLPRGYEIIRVPFADGGPWHNLPSRNEIMSRLTDSGSILGVVKYHAFWTPPETLDVVRRPSRRVKNKLKNWLNLILKMWVPLKTL